MFVAVAPSEIIDRERNDDPNTYELNEKDFDVYNGACALYCELTSIHSLWACCFFPICYYRVKTQDISMNSKKMHMKFDNFCEKQDNYLPLERIQDVNISQSCFARYWDVKSITISTAGGSPSYALALKDTEGFRNEVLRRRDALVHSKGDGQVMDDGTGGGNNVKYFANNKDRSEEELREVKQSLLRIEKLIESGLTKF
jgi:membrane protein YdbS with pleckstrin-like domain